MLGPEAAEVLSKPLLEGVMWCWQRGRTDRWSEKRQEKSEKGKKTETKVSGSI